jgi:RNA polymerase sigma-70 factor, ECF subfamily
MNEDDLKQLVAQGERGLAPLFEKHRESLERMIAFRLDDRIRGRVDPEDILQESYLEAARRLPSYLDQPTVSFYVWLRQIAYQTLINVQRGQFGQKRDPRAEVHAQPNGDATCHSILSMFSGQFTTPSRAMMKAEQFTQLRQILSEMDEVDREVLALRHFEYLTNNQVAEALGISITAASNRYIRAMTRLSQLAQNRIELD